MWWVGEIWCELLSLKEMKLGETDKQEKKQPNKPKQTKNHKPKKSEPEKRFQLLEITMMK